MDLAEQDGLVLLTLDKDFWQIAIQRRQPLERSGVILFRVPGDPREHHPVGVAHDGDRAGLGRARQCRHAGSRADGPAA